MTRQGFAQDFAVGIVEETAAAVALLRLSLWADMTAF
jgi:hypothetical protein